MKKGQHCRCSAARALARMTLFNSEPDRSDQFFEFELLFPEFELLKIRVGSSAVTPRL